MSNIDVNLEVYANDFRQTNGLNSKEAIRLKSILQKNNILTAYLPLSDDFSGMAIKLNQGDETKRFILVNSNQTIGRQHFTICHELYHLYFQKDFTSEKSIVGKFDKNNLEEYKADTFASYLLLPYSGLMQLIPEHERPKNKITLKTILYIENYYSCSRAALLIRLSGLNLIDKNHHIQFSLDIRKNALLYGYNCDLYNPGNENTVIGNYGSMARELFDKGVVSESSYFSLLEDMGIDLTDIDNKSDHE
jgi:Zn-dependent peptidase ImmA (M78 family)